MLPNDYLKERLKEIELRMLECLEMKEKAETPADKFAAKEAYEWAKMSRDVFLELMMIRSMDDKNLRPYDNCP